MFTDIPALTGWAAGRQLRDALAAIQGNFEQIALGVRSSGAADYVPVLGDKVISRTRATAQTVTIAPNSTAASAFDIGQEIAVEQTGEGELTIAAGVGVTIDVMATKTLVCAGQLGVVRLIKMATNRWNASGDLADFVE